MVNVHLKNFRSIIFIILSAALFLAGGSFSSLLGEANAAFKGSSITALAKETGKSMYIAKIILKKGDKGSKVLDIQKRLDVLGYNLPLTGYYGNDTNNAVKDYQEKNGLSQTGSIDEELYKKLLKIPLLSLGPSKLKSTAANVKDITSIESFINKNSFASYTKYFIWVNKASFNVAIFEGNKGEWKLVKKFPCTIGKGGRYETPAGIFQTGIKGDHFHAGSVSAKYYTQIKGNVLFHTILFDSKVQKIVDSRMKMRLSHGCIRLEIPNAVYIYKNVPQGTTVFIN